MGLPYKVVEMGDWREWEGRTMMMRILECCPSQGEGATLSNLCLQTGDHAATEDDNVQSLVQMAIMQGGPS